MNAVEPEWPFIEKLRVVSESKDLFGAELIAFLRREGLTAKLLEQWRQEARHRLYGGRSHLFRG